MIEDNGIGARIMRGTIPMLSFATGLTLLLGGIAAAAISIAKYESAMVAMTLSVAAALIGLAMIVATFRKWPTLTEGDPVTPRTRRYAWAMIALIAFSILVSTFFIRPGEGSISTELYSNGPLPTNIALGAAALWVLGLPVLSALTRRNMDEVERGHLVLGESIGFRFFTIAAPAWWLGFRGGVLPQPDVMLIFVAVLAASWAANMIRRLT